MQKFFNFVMAAAIALSLAVLPAGASFPDVATNSWYVDAVTELTQECELDGENLMYTLHFYAGTHGAELRRPAPRSLAGQRLGDGGSDGVRAVRILPVFAVKRAYFTAAQAPAWSWPDCPG